MFERVGRSVALLGGAAGLTFCLAGGVAVGLVPQAGTASVASPQSGVSTQADPTAAAPVPDTAAPEVAAPDAPAAVDTTVARSGSSSSSPAVADDTPSASSDAPDSSAAPAAASGPTTAPRLNPSSAQVKAAIAQLQAHNPMYVLTEAQARQFADQVCTAFDQGQTGAQVEAVAAAQAAKIPFASVSASDIDYAVTTAVQLFCPGYASRV